MHTGCKGFQSSEVEHACSLSLYISIFYAHSLCLSILSLPISSVSDLSFSFYLLLLSLSLSRSLYIYIYVPIRCFCPILSSLSFCPESLQLLLRCFIGGCSRPSCPKLYLASFPIAANWPGVGRDLRCAMQTSARGMPSQATTN